MQPVQVTSRDNPLLVRVRKLAHDPSAYRKLGEVWLEGDHLCLACVQKNHPALHAIASESGWAHQRVRELCRHAARQTVVPDALFKGISGLESPADVGFIVAWNAGIAIDPDVASVVLDQLQDAGNVGSILRSAAAFGLKQVIALRGTAALWSPKVLRAGMGAHFGLRLVESVDAGVLDVLRVPLVATSSHTHAELHAVPLPVPCAWVLGHEGQGVSQALQQRCALSVRIPQPGGEESLNVAAAAAVCFYESLRRGLVPVSR